MVSKNKRRATKPSLIANNTTFDNCIKQQRYDYIPLDYVCFEVKGLTKEDILKGKKYSLITIKTAEDEGSEVIKVEILKWKGIKIRFYPNSIKLNGSLHKYSNDGHHNFDQFTEDSFLEVIDRLYFDFNIRPRNLYIKGLEFGLNVSPPIQTDFILNGLMMHRTKEFEQKISNDRGKFYGCEHQNYVLKAYNKGKQYKLPYEVFRIEIKQKRWDEYREKGYVYFDDFIKADKSIFVNKLFRVWSEVILCDLTVKSRIDILKYSNVNFWRNQYSESDKREIDKHKSRLKKLSKTKGLDVIRLTTNNLITTLNDVQSSTKYNFSTEVKRCALTGLNITQQRKDSFLLSHVGIKTLLSNDRKTFYKIRKT